MNDKRTAKGGTGRGDRSRRAGRRHARPPSWSPTAPASGSARGGRLRRSSRASARGRGGACKVSGVPTSEASARLARSLEIPLIEIDRGDAAGPHRRRRRRGDAQPRSGQGAGRRLRARADRGGGLAPADHPGDPREAGPGAVRARKGFPVEVIPMAAGLATRRLKALGLSPVQRVDPATGGPLISVNGNLIFDCGVSRPLAEPALARDAGDRHLPRSRASSTPGCSSAPPSACWSVTPTGASKSSSARSCRERSATKSSSCSTSTTPCSTTIG